MSSFKRKPTKKCHSDKRQMIDDIHLVFVKDMMNRIKSLILFREWFAIE